MCVTFRGVREGFSEEPVMAEHFGAGVGREHSREREDPARGKDKLRVEELQTGGQHKGGRDKCGGRHETGKQMGVEERESEGSVGHSGRTGSRQTRAEGKRAFQGKNRPHAEAYAGELTPSTMRARDCHIQEYVSEDVPLPVFKVLKGRDRVRKI